MDVRKLRSQSKCDVSLPHVLWKLTVWHMWRLTFCLWNTWTLLIYWANPFLKGSPKKLSFKSHLNDHESQIDDDQTHVALCHVRLFYIPSFLKITTDSFCFIMIYLKPGVGKSVVYFPSLGESFFVHVLQMSNRDLNNNSLHSGVSQFRTFSAASAISQGSVDGTWVRGKGPQAPCRVEEESWGWIPPYSGWHTEPSNSQRDHTVILVS